jgi:hypothetical protein
VPSVTGSEAIVATDKPENLKIRDVAVKFKPLVVRHWSSAADAAVLRGANERHGGGLDECALIYQSLCRLRWLMPKLNHFSLYLANPRSVDIDELFTEKARLMLKAGEPRRIASPKFADGAMLYSVYSADLDGKNERNFLYAQGNVTGIAYVEI